MEAGQARDIGRDGGVSATSWTVCLNDWEIGFVLPDLASVQSLLLPVSSVLGLKRAAEVSQRFAALRSMGSYYSFCQKWPQGDGEVLLLLDLSAQHDHLAVKAVHK